MIPKSRIKDLLQEVCGFLGIEEPELIFTEKNRGLAKRVRTVDGFKVSITLPENMLSHGEALAKYYVVHEAAHLATNNPKHDEQFKTKEMEVLAALYSIGIKHKRAYPKYLFDINNPKNILWGMSEKILGRGKCLEN